MGEESKAEATTAACKAKYDIVGAWRGRHEVWNRRKRFVDAAVKKDGGWRLNVKKRASRGVAGILRTQRDS